MDIRFVKKIVARAQYTFSPTNFKLTDRDPVTGTIDPYNGVHPPTAVFGMTTEYPSLTPDNLWDKIKPSSPVAHVATVDDASCSKGGDKKIILTVGINYTQFSSSPSFKWKICDNTLMGRAVNTVLRFCGFGLSSTPTNYHLVATNIFPWITVDLWSSLFANAIEEAIFLDCVGYKYPYAHLNFLIQAFGNDLEYIIFHGANNAVPYLGADFLRRHSSRPISNPPTRVIFCDNLAPPFTLRNIIKWNF